MVYYFDRCNLQYDGDCAEGGFGKLSSITDDVYQVFGRRPLFNSFCGEDAEKEEGFAELEGSSWFLLLGFVGMVLSMSIYQMSVKEVPASVVAVLFSSNPIFTAVLAFLC